MSSDSYLLNIDKPAGMTSRDVVDRVARMARTKRVGHAGTLDPMATGVLVVAVGKGTRLVEYVQQQLKTYEATFLLGATSDTDDIEGNVVRRESVDRPGEDAVRRGLASFVGTIQQVPPQFSALKVGGKRAYKLARKGDAVPLKPRPVRVEAVDLLAYNGEEVRVHIRCGSGTYIRSIARDLGELLGTGGLMSELRRTAVGVFRVEEAVRLDQLEQTGVIDSFQRSLIEAVAMLPKLTVGADSRKRFLLGQRFQGSEECDSVNEAAVIDHAGEFLGIAERDRDGQWKPAKGGFAVDDAAQTLADQTNC